MVVLVSIWLHLALSMFRLNAASRFFIVRWLRLTCLTLISLARNEFGVVLVIHHYPRSAGALSCAFSTPPLSPFRWIGAKA